MAKSVIVTGASSGIGFATALEFHKRGWNVFACARRLEAMQPLKDEGINVIRCDVTSAEDVAKLKQYVSEQTGGSLDVLFNNAGAPCMIPATDVTDEEALDCFKVNVLAPVRLTREFTPLLIKAQGLVAFTGSLAGIVPFPYSSIYGSSKAAIHHYAQTLHLELGMFGVRVLNFVTGAVDTNIGETRPLRKDSLLNFPEGIESHEYRLHLAKNNSPLLPEDFAKQIVTDMEKAKPGDFNKYRGNRVYLFLGTTFLPRFVIELLLRWKFKLYGIIRRLKEMRAKKQD